jgi:hypothetical protein
VILFFVVWSFHGSELIDYFLDVLVDSKKIEGPLIYSPKNFDKYS